MIEDWRGSFDVALALHACGNATDRVLQMAVARRAAYVCSPCCVGARAARAAASGRRCLGGGAGGTQDPQPAS